VKDDGGQLTEKKTREGTGEGEEEETGKEKREGEEEREKEGDMEEQRKEVISNSHNPFAHVFLRASCSSAHGGERGFESILQRRKVWTCSDWLRDKDNFKRQRRIPIGCRYM
jgi:hypothetical protein